ncbi:glycerophosphodiester phosphodiesterase [Paenibacillus prosopidis]|uniref:Glycerophosphoryl diester phosphodiesterase n=1 Tax=Paenibacillus prosopidis TaxID=630520 RepID=A0A368WA45_9BACL|nr:glycerophosphodiester phosphodiesterase family protein [Paenibacillus prosopidis]RCW51966.1 glycerophosphoryl diester phosphodiesterase [Paenibacillus prosopidis]
MARRKASFVWFRAGLFMLILCCAALTVSAYSPYKAEGSLILAHRGASGYAPENTMAAFKLAERLGADFIELDVRMSKDGGLVVIHDKTVDRTTNKTGFVHDYTLRELQGMDAGSFYDKAYAHERLLSLEEVMYSFAGRIGILIEIKDPQLYPGIEEKLAKMVRRYELIQDIAGIGVGDSIQGKDGTGGSGGRAGPEEIVNSEGGASIIIQSFDFESMRRMHTLLPDIPVAVLIHADQHPLTDKKLDKLASYASSFNISHDLLNEELVREIHERNRKVMAWTIRKDQDMERMRELGVDGIITDYPG